MQELVGVPVERTFEWTFMDRRGKSFTELPRNRRLAHRDAAGLAAMPRRHPQNDPEDPGAQAGAPLELGQSAVNDEKNILRCIFQGRLGYAKATQISPDQRGAALIHLRKGGR